MNFIFIYFGILLTYSYFDYRRSYSRSRIQKKNFFLLVFCSLIRNFAGVI